MLDIALYLCLILAFIIGANSVMGSLGASYGSRILSMRKTLLLIIVFSLLGVFLFGHLLMRTVSTGIAFIADPFPIALSVVVVSFVILIFKIPASITQIVLGCLLGSALANSASIAWQSFSVILLSLMASPLICIILSGVFYTTYMRFMIGRKITERVHISINKFFVYSQIAIGCCLAAAIGANDVGVVMGLEFGFEPLLLLELIGGMGIAIGILVFGRQIIRHVSRGLVPLTPDKGFFAQLAGLATLIIFLSFSIPVPPNTVMVGSLIGIGLATRNINKRMTFDILVLWVITLPISVFTGFAIETLI
jgi:phosphate/sulfate permease